MITFWICFGAIFFIIAFCDKKYNLLRDESTAIVKSYSFARVQFAFWNLMILPGFIAVTFHGQIPDLGEYTIALLGISAGTMGAARFIDSSEKGTRHQNDNGQNFFLDILSDENGISMHRIQTVIINVAIGVWFMCKIIYGLKHNVDTNLIIPNINQGTLILLGLSSATYIGLKSQENK